MGVVGGICSWWSPGALVLDSVAELRRQRVTGAAERLECEIPGGVSCGAGCRGDHVPPFDRVLASSATGPHHISAMAAVGPCCPKRRARIEIRLLLSAQLA